jgi:hypothetical protein
MINEKGQFVKKPIEWKEEPCQYPELGNCFICTSHSKSKSGHIIYRWNGQANRMSRYLHTQLFGEIPSKMQVCHKCDNPSCINPEHFFLGTIQDNMKDMVNKNRQAKGIKKWSSKLTEQQVYEILEDNSPRKEIQKHYGVSKACIQGIKSGRKWKYLQEAI